MRCSKGLHGTFVLREAAQQHKSTTAQQQKSTTAQQHNSKNSKTTEFAFCLTSEDEQQSTDEYKQTHVRLSNTHVISELLAHAQ